MSQFKAKMHQIRFPASIRSSIRLCLRWSLTHSDPEQRIRVKSVRIRYSQSVHFHFHSQQFVSVYVSLQRYADATKNAFNVAAVTIADGMTPLSP